MAEEKKTTRKKIQATDLMNKIMADYFYGLNEAATTGKRKVAWCTSVGPAELLQAHGVRRSLPGKPRRHARRDADVDRPDPGGERDRLFARHLLVSHGRHRRVPEGDHPALQGVPGDPVGAEARCPGLQHEPVPRRAGLVGLVLEETRGPLHRGHLSQERQRRDRRPHRRRHPADRGPDPDARGDRRGEARHGPAAGDGLPVRASAPSCGSRSSRRRSPPPPRSPSSTGRSTWGRPSSSGGPRRRSTTTRSCSPNSSRGSGTAWEPSTGRARGSTGKGCPCGDACGSTPSCSRISSRPSWPPPTAAAGSSRPSTGSTRSGAWRRRTSSCSSSAPTGTRSSTSRR